MPNSFRHYQYKLRRNVSKSTVQAHAHALQQMIGNDSCWRRQFTVHPSVNYYFVYYLRLIRISSENAFAGQFFIVSSVDKCALVEFGYNESTRLTSIRSLAKFYLVHQQKPPLCNFPLIDRLQCILQWKLSLRAQHKTWFGRHEKQFTPNVSYHGYYIIETNVYSQNIQLRNLSPMFMLLPGVTQISVNTFSSTRDQFINCCSHLGYSSTLKSTSSIISFTSHLGAP